MRYAWLIALFCLQSLALHAGDSCRFLLRHDIQATLHNAAIGMPPHIINGRMHPGLEVGFLQTLSKKVHKNNPEQGVFLGYMAQQALQRSIYAKYLLGYKIKTYKSWWVKPGLQLGVMAVHQRNAEFKLNAQGQYEKISVLRAQFLSGLHLETGLHVGYFKQYPLQLVGRYEFAMQWPFSQISSLLPINQVHVGLRASNRK
ncbi:MAG: hypothetical protein ACR2IL_07325 [Chitinophagaceae bacterium]